MDKKQITELLVDSGWNEKRTVNIDETYSFLKNEGYTINDNQLKFLRQNEGLLIEFDNPRLPKLKEILNLNSVEAASTVFRSLVEEYEKYCGTSFVIIGEIEQENMTVYIDSKGEFYGGFDDCLIKLGESFEECLFNLVNGTKLEVIFLGREYGI